MTTLKQLSLETKNTLSSITDPYHDFNLPNPVYPDAKKLFTYARRRTARVTVSCPWVLDPGETWSFHIFTSPLHNQTSLAISTLTGGSLTGPTTLSVSAIGPINIIYTRWLGNTIVSQNHASHGPLQGVSTPTRTVAFGYELHDTTASIYQCGALTQYRTNSIDSRVDLSARTLASNVPFPSSFNHILSIPVNITAANQLPNTRTWEAKRGVYAVCLPDYDNNYSTDLPRNIVITGCNPTGSNDVMATIQMPGATAQYCSYSPMHCAGTFVTGLQQNNTFTLDWRQFLEIAPNPEDAGDVELSSKTPPMNTHFIKLYQQMISDIPPGVHVSSNASGDWFRGILSIVNSVLPTVSQFLPPKAQLIAAPISMGLKALENKLEKKITAVAKQQPKIVLSKPAQALIKKSKRNLRSKRDVANRAIFKK